MPHPRVQGYRELRRQVPFKITPTVTFNRSKMDFLKSAVASAISKGPPFPYTFGDKVDIDQSIWTLYNGTRRVDISLPPL